MKIQELKQKVKAGFSPYKDRYYLENIDKIFSEYECQQSNKSDEEPEKKEDSETFSFRRELDEVWECIDKMSYSKLATEIEALKKQVEAIDKVKVIDSDLNQKQERFYIFESEFSGLSVVDRDKKIKLFKFYEDDQLYEICEILNSLEASKNE